MRVQISQIRIPRIHKILLFIVMGLVIAGCSLMQSGVRIRVVDTPQGVSSLNTGTIVTLAESHPVQTRSWKINSSKADKSDTSSKDLEVVATVFDNKVRLINLYPSNSRGRIELSFTSTAQSLVLLNPIFIGLIAEKNLKSFKELRNILLLQIWPKKLRLLIPY